MTEHTRDSKQSPRSSICNAELEKRQEEAGDEEKSIEYSLIKVKKELHLAFLRTKQTKNVLLGSCPSAIILIRERHHFLQGLQNRQVEIHGRMGKI